MHKTILPWVFLAFGASTAAAQQQRDPNSMGGGDCAANVYNCADTPNPLPAPNTVWIEEMTWMDVRDALADGKTTVIIPTAGVEPNGPWLATGKHIYVLRANCDAIARELGNALCAPIVKFVPEGNIDPPSSHMTSPGTISVREETFRAMLTDVAHSLKVHGFENIVFIGDSGGNQGGQRAVADRLNAEWGETVVAHVQEYYDYAGVNAHMTSLGYGEGESDGLHDDAYIALNMFADDPYSIRYEERVATGHASINGFSLEDRVRNVELAREIVSFRANHTAGFIQQAIAQGGTTPVAPRPQRAGGGGGRGGQAGQRPAPDPRTMGGGDCRNNEYNCSDTPNPLPPTNTVRLEEMTWMDVRDALAAGKTTAIISTGGMEPNGPWLVTGKHNYVLRANCDRIARDLGNAICAPVLELVPEGAIEPPSGHMRSPGTISLREETFEAVLTDIAESLHQHGFENIVFIGDSGGNQSGMESVAGALNAKWTDGARAHFIGEYYRAPAGSRNVLRELGVTTDDMPSDGLHDSPAITLNMMLDDPKSVRWAERVRTGQASINGVDISDLTQALTWAEEIAAERSERTADLIRVRIRQR
jgi:creatinine amidohydrolase/Fe(II)-dependent formamide hydrolase-like protein